MGRLRPLGTQGRCLQASKGSHSGERRSCRSSGFLLDVSTPRDPPPPTSASEHTLLLPDPVSTQVSCLCLTLALRHSSMLFLELFTSLDFSAASTSQARGSCCLCHLCALGTSTQCPRGLAPPLSLRRSCSLCLTDMFSVSTAGKLAGGPSTKDHNQVFSVGRHLKLHTGKLTVCPPLPVIE